jgi:acetyl-CoA C-acetyltransferase
MKEYTKSPDDIVIVSGARTAIGKFGGSLKDKTAIELGALVVREAVERAGIDPAVVGEVIIGQVGQIAENGFVARAISLSAGLPNETTAYSVNRQCGSGLQSIVDAVLEIKCGMNDVVVAGGSENLSQLPYYVKDARWGARMGHKTFEDGVIDILTWPLGPYHNGVTAENVARKYNVSREEQDAFAARSQQRAVAAVNSGIFADEIVDVELKDRKGNVTVFNVDESQRDGVTAEKLAKLRPCFAKDEEATVTAGNSSSLNDAAAAVVVMTRAKAEELGCTPMATIRGYAVAGFDGDLMGYSPYYSTKKLSEQLGIDPRDVDMFELNEAFASQAVAVSRDLGLDDEKLNIYGGGISLGHPIGATGTILAIKCMYEFQRSGKQDAMISMCIGGGQGISMYLTKE